MFSIKNKYNCYLTRLFDKNVIAIYELIQILWLTFYFSKVKLVYNNTLFVIPVIKCGCSLTVAWESVTVAWTYVTVTLEGVTVAWLIVTWETVTLTLLSVTVTWERVTVVWLLP